MLNKPLSIAALVVALVPIAAFSLGLLLDYSIPGCEVDEGAGARNCILLGSDISDLVEVLELVGFLAALLGVPLGIGLLVLAAIVGFFGPRRRSP